MGPESSLQHRVSLPWTIRALLDTAPCLVQKSPLQDGGDDEEVPEAGSTELCQRRPQAQSRTMIYLGRDQKLGVSIASSLLNTLIEIW